MRRLMLWWLALIGMKLYPTSPYHSGADAYPLTLSIRYHLALPEGRRCYA